MGLLVGLEFYVPYLFLVCKLKIGWSLKCKNFLRLKPRLIFNPMYFFSTKIIQGIGFSRQNTFGICHFLRFGVILKTRTYFNEIYFFCLCFSIYFV